MGREYIVLKRKVFFSEKEGVSKTEGGRKVTWLIKSSDNQSNHMTICTIEIEPSNRVAPAHMHTNSEEAVYIISGKGKALIGDEISDIGPGTLLYFPEKIPHMLWNTGDELIKGVCFYAPCQGKVVYRYCPEVDFPEFKKNKN